MEEPNPNPDTPAEGVKPDDTPPVADPLEGDLTPEQEQPPADDDDAEDVEASAPVDLVPRRRLNPQQLRFVEHYLATSSPRQAAILAGYKPHRADKRGDKLLRTPHVAAAIREALAVHTARVNITAESVIRETGLMAFSSVADYSLGRDGVLRLANPGVDPGAIRAVKTYWRKEKVLRRTVDDESGQTEELVEIESSIQMHDKSRGLMFLLQHMGLLKQPVPVVPTDDPVKELLKRLPADIAGAISALLASAGPKPVEHRDDSSDDHDDGSGG